MAQVSSFEHFNRTIPTPWISGKVSERGLEIFSRQIPYRALNDPFPTGPLGFDTYTRGIPFNLLPGQSDSTSLEYFSRGIAFRGIQSGTGGFTTPNSITVFPSAVSIASSVQVSFSYLINLTFSSHSAFGVNPPSIAFDVPTAVSSYSSPSAGITPGLFSIIGGPASSTSTIPAPTPAPGPITVAPAQTVIQALNIDPIVSNPNVTPTASISSYSVPAPSIVGGFSVSSPIANTTIIISDPVVAAGGLSTQVAASGPVSSVPSPTILVGGITVSSTPNATTTTGVQTPTVTVTGTGGPTISGTHPSSFARVKKFLTRAKVKNG